MVRTHSQRDAAMLLRLPSDMLLKIASHVVSPDLVVAAGKNLEARTALRKGTDAAERSRFGGTIGLTVREAEHRLRTQYTGALETNDLVSRKAAGLALIMKTPWDNDESAMGIYEELAKTLIAYGADVNVKENSEFDVGYILLHVAYKADDPVAFARLLLAAGANIDARATPPNAAGLSPLAWSIECGDETESSYALASFLIEQGCDVVEASADFTYQKGRSLVDVLERRARTEGRMRLVDQIHTAICHAGTARYMAALEAAQSCPRFEADSDSDY